MVSTFVMADTVPYRCGNCGKTWTLTVLDTGLITARWQGVRAFERAVQAADAAGYFRCCETQFRWAHD